MADPFVAEIRPFAFGFVPRGWALCNGALLPIAQNTALFSLLGTTYGGNGQSTFGLPNLQGQVAVGSGQGPGLSDRWLGETGGSAQVTLLESEIPAHSHEVRATSAEATLRQPAPDRALAATADEAGWAPAGAVPVATSPLALGTAGGSQPHENRMPFLVIQYCIALQGVFPPRS